jgi:hypothetical protein
VSIDDRVILQFTLPGNYPSSRNPVVGVSAPSLSKTQHQSLQTRLNSILDDLSSSSEERLLEIIESFREQIQTTSTSSTTETAGPEPSPASISSVPQGPTVVVLIWFHHLLSTTKRKAIKSLDSLRGISKPGYPGILVLQGPKTAIDEAITELKSMRWQAIQVRGEIECEKPLIQHGIHEVEKVAEVVGKLDEIGLGDWCLSALKMK